jgi:hypothetical protein
MSIDCTMPPARSVARPPARRCRRGTARRIRSGRARALDDAGRRWPYEPAQGGQVLRDAFGIDISLGALSASEAIVSAAVAPTVEEARVHALAEHVKHVDATAWYQAGAHKSLWVLATAAVTVFTIACDATRDTLRTWITQVKGVLVTDRGTQFRILGDGAAADLLGAPDPQVRSVLRAPGTHGRDRTRVAVLGASSSTPITGSGMAPVPARDCSVLRSRSERSLNACSRKDAICPCTA